MTPCGCDSFLIGIAVHCNRAGNSTVVVEKKLDGSMPQTRFSCSRMRYRSGKDSIMQIKNCDELQHFIWPLYPTDQIINPAMARALHADACRRYAIVAWVVLWDLPAHPERFAARLVTIAALTANLSAKLDRAPTDQEVARVLAMSVAKLRRLRG
jgi:hypothetical protein